MFCFQGNSSPELFVPKSKSREPIYLSDHHYLPAQHWFPVLVVFIIRLTNHMWNCLLKVVGLEKQKKSTDMAGRESCQVNSWCKRFHEMTENHQQVSPKMFKKTHVCWKSLGRLYAVQPPGWLMYWGQGKQIVWMQYIYTKLVFSTKWARKI
jgi:hypothetical protein